MPGVRFCVAGLCHGGAIPLDDVFRLKHVKPRAFARAWPGDKLTISWPVVHYGLFLNKEKEKMSKAIKATKKSVPSNAGTRKNKHVYFFGAKQSEGDVSMRALLGGKGANLADMAGLGLPVPPGFTITTEACAKYYQIGEKALHALIRDEVRVALEKLEKTTGKTFGAVPNPLLVSVRSGAAASMPGMRDTVLNLGLNPETVEAMIARTRNHRFV